MKHGVLFLVLVFSSITNAQNFIGTARLFEDYATCLMGMKNGYNEVIYEAQFDETELVHKSTGAFWIVGIDERYGLLHRLWGFYSNDELIDPLFTSVSTVIYKNQRFVFVGEKVGIMNAKNEYSIPLQDLDSLISNYDLQKELEISQHDNSALGLGAIEIKNGLHDN